MSVEAVSEMPVSQQEERLSTRLSTSAKGVVVAPEANTSQHSSKADASSEAKITKAFSPRVSQTAKGPHPAHDRAL